MSLLTTAAQRQRGGHTPTVVVDPCAADVADRLTPLGYPKRTTYDNVEAFVDDYTNVSHATED